MSESRKKRKRDRRHFLSGGGDRRVRPFRFGGVLGDGPAHPGRDNLHLICRAINKDWPMPPEKRAAIMAHLSGILRDKSANERTLLAAVNCMLAADRANLRLFKAILDSQLPRKDYP